MQAATRLISPRLCVTAVLRVPACSMYENPYIARFKQKVPEGFKQDTGLTGLKVLTQPHFELTSAYKRILHILEQIPSDAAYRKYTEGIVNQRLQLVEQEKDVAKLEEKIGMGQVEELLEQAQYELETAKHMLQYRVWEPLAEQPPEHQWTWPV